MLRVGFDVRGARSSSSRAICSQMSSWWSADGFGDCAAGVVPLIASPLASVDEASSIASSGLLTDPDGPTSRHPPGSSSDQLIRLVTTLVGLVASGDAFLAVRMPRFTLVGNTGVFGRLDLVAGVNVVVREP